MPSFQPISGAAMSALIWELDSNAAAIFGPSPIAVPSNIPAWAGGRLARALKLVRNRALPWALKSMNTSKITIIQRTRVQDPDDPLGYRFVPANLSVYAAVSGPTAENLERGLLVASDYEVLIAATSLTGGLDAEAAIQLNGVNHDIVGIQAHPKTPPAVAYRFMCKRAA